MNNDVEDKPRYAIMAAVQTPAVSDVEFEGTPNEVAPD